MKFCGSAGFASAAFGASADGTTCEGAVGGAGKALFTNAEPVGKDCEAALVAAGCSGCSSEGTIELRGRSPVFGWFSSRGVEKRGKGGGTTSRWGSGLRIAGLGGSGGLVGAAG